MKSIAHATIKIFGGSLLVGLVGSIIIEFVAYSYFDFVLDREHWVPIHRRADTTVFWRTEGDPWGAWHLPNSTARQVDDCFDVPVQSNSYGARDRERTKVGSGRILVLGDSYVEGWGVREEHRFTEVIEGILSREVLNFGSDWFMGPLQYEILYRELASEFEHELLIIGFAPHNDFTDNDLSIWQEYAPHRYRPYYDPETQTPVYLVDRPQSGQSLADLRRGQTSLFWLPRDLAMTYTWSYGLWEKTIQFLAKPFREVRNASPNVNPMGRYSGYRDFKESQFRNVLGSFDRLIELARASNRQVLLTILPARNDLELSDGENRLHPLMMQYGRDREVTVLDLLRQASLSPSDFQECSWLWSERGHEKIGRIIASKAQELLKE